MKLQRIYLIFNTYIFQPWDYSSTFSPPCAGSQCGCWPARHMLQQNVADLKSSVHLCPMSLFRENLWCLADYLDPLQLSATDFWHLLEALSGYDFIRPSTTGSHFSHNLIYLCKTRFDRHKTYSETNKHNTRTVPGSTSGYEKEPD